MNVQVQTWGDVKNRYIDLPTDSIVKESMLGLIAHVSKTEFGSSLYPWSSMLDLRITQTEAHPFGGSVPYLLISPFSDGRAEFRYVDTMVKSKQWVRIADRGRLGERFDSFVEQLNWRRNGK